MAVCGKFKNHINFNKMKIMKIKKFNFQLNNIYGKRNNVRCNFSTKKFLS